MAMKTASKCQMSIPPYPIGVGCGPSGSREIVAGTKVADLTLSSLRPFAHPFTPYREDSAHIYCQLGLFLPLFKCYTLFFSFSFSFSLYIVLYRDYQYAIITAYHAHYCT